MQLTTLFLAALGSAQAFSPAFTSRPTTFLQEGHIEKGFTADSGMNVNDIPLYIDNLTAENFDESVEMFEALLTNECVGDSCEDLVGRLEDKAESLGKKLPEGFGSKHH